MTAPSSLLHDIAMAPGSGTAAEVQREVDLLLAELRQDHVLAPLDPAAGPAPFRLALSTMTAQQLDLTFTSLATGAANIVSLPLGPLRRNIHDYGLICESFYNAGREGQGHRLETIDMARRGLHDEAALELIDLMDAKLRLDKATARRLFSLIYILSKRQSALQ